ncbi:sigma-70 family RNA polymerase sigma factor [Mycoplasmoides genitalium]|uniref:Uncharacterized protein MG428 n=2 Tax=Mycoplasmoides genitalium TaxID=2097 RepID=Y428_MYCGE|nr:sigma-70 family RNA polymerase sigma factor [Mycoplasmoides genitalium]P47667.1 RecName: Full=Uncharacterized protein MG428 [Mycoplasmoides genitalium G37]ABY79310.1 LuxR bacterial regulatory protein, putative [synthetic Mycoplasma genitalium JCVI-1.0]AAC72449.1 LuxR bacterial regulatory protein, putative [Mycoplasmoides genitalium G37]AFQ03267.1 LuxR regulatory protein [Mycoplasmoides genitalium M2321]AFQ03752.1 LuxR regulatory protein [Mycoplasmoides genitalium M6282]AFQ04261.1 LuxR regu
MKNNISDVKLGLLAAKIYWKSWRFLELTEDDIISIALHAEQDSKKRFNPEFGLSFDNYLKLNGANFIRSSFRSMVNKVELLDSKSKYSLEKQNTVLNTPENYLRSLEFKEIITKAFNKAKNDQERKVFSLYVKGYKNFEIAKKLNISPRRVRYLLDLFKSYIKLLTERYGY